MLILKTSFFTGKSHSVCQCILHMAYSKSFHMAFADFIKWQA